MLGPLISAKEKRQLNLNGVSLDVLVVRVASWTTAETRIMASFSHRVHRSVWDIACCTKSEKVHKISEKKVYSHCESAITL